jgi:hypothetical protein
MKKSVWLVLVLFALAVFTPAAHADTYTYTFTGTSSFTTTSFTLVDTSGPLTFSDTANDAGFLTTSTDVIVSGLDEGPIGQIYIVADGSASYLYVFTSAGSGFGGPLSVSDLSVDGTYSFVTGYATFTISSTPSTTVAPEPGSIALVLAGAGLLGLLALRKQTA